MSVQLIAWCLLSGLKIDLIPLHRVSDIPLLYHIEKGCNIRALQLVLKMEVFEKMYGIGAGFLLLGTIFLSFGCLIAAFRSLASVSQAYDRESRLTAITGFIFGVIFSIIFGLATIYQLNRMHAISQTLMGG